MEKVDLKDTEERNALIDGWFACLSRQIDANRIKDVALLAERVLFAPDNHWFKGPNPWSFILLRPLFEGAELHLVTNRANGFRAQPGATAQILRDIMLAAGLSRLTAFVPDVRPTDGCQHLVAQLGFKVEGRLRSAALFDGQLADLVMWGALLEDLYRGTDNGSNSGNRSDIVRGGSTETRPTAGRSDRGSSGQPQGADGPADQRHKRRRRRRKKRR